MFAELLVTPVARSEGGVDGRMVPVRWLVPSPHAGSMNGEEAPAEVVVGRYQGTVMVTVHGELDPAKVAHLRLLLTDLIDGQGNVAVIVDLQDATAADDDPGAWRSLP